MTATTIELEGTTFYGTDRGGSAFVLNGEVTGLLDAPSVRMEEIPRPEDHGDFDVPGKRGPRLITLAGWWRAADEADARGMRDALMGILADGSAGTVTHTELGVELTLSARLFGDQRFKRSGSSLMGNWSLKLRAANPRMYGETHSFTGSELSSIEHAGNFPASPRLITAGSDAGGYTVTGPGGRLITVTEPLVTDHPHTLDLASGALRIDGDRVFGGITVYQPWSVPSGTAAAASVSAGTLTVEVEDTFI